MAFRSLQGNVSLLLLLSVYLHFITENSAALSSRETCECVQKSGSVQWRKIKDYTIIQKDTLCNEVQIIVQLSDQKVCLNPESKQGKKIQRCWNRIKFNAQKKKLCLKLKRKNAPKRPKKH